MYILTCRELGLSCPFEVREETIHEILEKIIDHIEDNHLEEWGKMEKKLDLQEEREFLLKHIKDDNKTPV
jgi:predicted small metal-binding protein